MPWRSSSGGSSKTSILFSLCTLGNSIVLSIVFELFNNSNVSSIDGDFSSVL
jgi:hypothetical protein